MFQRLALAGVVVLLLTSCGGADDPEASEPGPTENVSGSTTGGSGTSDSSDQPTASDAPDETDNARERVAKERFCPDIDPERLGSILGLAGLEVLVDSEPREGGSEYWTCTIGQHTGTSVGVTMNILDATADPSNVAATLDAFSTSLGPDNCTNVGDEALGPGTRGVDCSGTSSGTGFTMVARAAVVAGTQIECLLASYGPDDLADLKRAAPEVCGLFRDEVVS